MIKKGDTVRFLNAVGGGLVIRVDEAKKMLYVEDADGFEIPVLERECVMVGVVNKETNFPVKDFKTKPETIKLDNKEISLWLGKGAKPTETVRKLIE